MTICVAGIPVQARAVSANCGTADEHGVMQPDTDCGTPGGNNAIREDSVCGQATGSGEYDTDNDCGQAAGTTGGGATVVYNDGDCAKQGENEADPAHDGSCGDISTASAGTGFFEADDRCGTGEPPFTAIDVDCNQPCTEGGGILNDGRCGQLREDELTYWQDQSCGVLSIEGGSIYEDSDCGLTNPMGGTHSDSSP